MRKLIVCCTAFCILVGCEPVEGIEEDDGYPLAEIVSIGDLVYDAPQLASVLLEGTYLGAEDQVNVTCTMTGDGLALVIDQLNTPHPSVPARDPDMPCDPVVLTEDTWSVHCRQHVISPLFYWWDDFTITLDRSDWTGHFDWYVDGGEYFHCLRVFEIDKATFSYVE